jgi:hypothetical protein
LSAAVQCSFLLSCLLILSFFATFDTSVQAGHSLGKAGGLKHLERRKAFSFLFGSLHDTISTTKTTPRFPTSFLFFFLKFPISNSHLLLLDLVTVAPPTSSPATSTHILPGNSPEQERPTSRPHEKRTYKRSTLRHCCNAFA